MFLYANAPYEGLSGGAIAGIVVGSVAFVSLVALLCVGSSSKRNPFPTCLQYSRKNNKSKKRRFSLCKREF